ncbi:lysozyme inhibitor [Aurantimonas aggregata]|uniref:Lysozyme inhibitor n=1 Tax=Aurantimonas aggregata TaxID=2047720 RepID=A0A6L9MIA5_9HYPH|nr:MliC family protein [Aurantimonas aggregata]NDV87302.1 lysozyme inhibitor [Aurantimonas aggregata]
MMRRFAMAIAAALALVAPATNAQTLTPLTLELPGTAERTTVAYACKAGADAEATPLSVEYINLPGNNFALLPIDGEPTLFVGVLAGSGAKYVAKDMVWWTKGPRGDLYSERTPDAADRTVCQVQR